MMDSIGVLPIVQNIKAFYRKNFGDGKDYWEEIKKDNENCNNILKRSQKDKKAVGQSRSLRNVSNSIVLV